MSRTLVLAAVVLAVTAPMARGDDPKPPATPLERIEALQKEMNQKLSALQAEVATLKAQVARVDTTQNVLLDTWEMRNQIESLQAEVTRLREQLAAAKRATPPSVAPVPLPPPAPPRPPGPPPAAPDVPDTPASPAFPPFPPSTLGPYPENDSPRITLQAGAAATSAASAPRIPRFILRVRPPSVRCRTRLKNFTARRSRGAASARRRAGCA